MSATATASLSNVVGQSAIQTLGTITDGGGNPATKAWLKSASAASNGSGFGVKSPSTVYWYPKHLPWIAFRVKTDTNVSAWRSFFGFTTSDYTNSDSLPGDCCGFWKSTVAGHTTIQVGRRDGTSQSVTDTVVDLLASTEYLFWLQIENGGLDIRWAIKNVTTGTLTEGFIAGAANMPRATQGLLWNCIGFTTEAVAKNLFWNSMDGGTLPYGVG